MYRLVVVLVLVVGLGAAAACTNSSGTAASSARQASSSANASLSPSGSSELDAAVVMPSGFPADVPIYPGARLTAEAPFTSSTGTTWGVEWETHDGVAKVGAFYTSKLAQGDWTLQSSETKDGRYSAGFTRKSNSKFVGILAADGSSGVTRISLALGTSS